MSNFDDKLKKALNDDSRELDKLVAQSQPGLIQMTLSVFRGQGMALNIMAYIIGIVFFVLMIIFAVQFFNVDTTRDQILYATLFMFCNGAVMAMKLWFWMVMNRNAVTREIKRLELQVAKLSAQSQS